jgi:hypothetical protein
MIDRFTGAGQRPPQGTDQGPNGGLEPGMSKDRSDAMFARIGSYAQVLATLIGRMRQAWDSPHAYRPGEHYMRGPGPKWREKHGQDRSASGVQQPMMLGDKWDF